MLLLLNINKNNKSKNKTNISKNIKKYRNICILALSTVLYV